MKKRTRNLGLLMVVAAFGCHSNTTPASAGRDTIQASRQFEKPANKFAGIQMASKKDTSCGMPLSAGLEDTVQLAGNVYGFCSKECKNNFVAKLKEEHKR